MKKFEFVVFVFIGLVILFAGKYQPDNTEETTVSIGGMTCSKCADKIGNALSNLDGIIKSSVSLTDNNAVVTYDPAVLKIEDIRNTIAKAGFSADDVPAVTKHGEDEKETAKKEHHPEEKDESHKECAEKKDNK